MSAPHIIERWGEPPKNLKETKDKYQKKIDLSWNHPFFLIYDNKPIGYIQSYYAPEAGDGWWENEPEGTWGLDMFIGEEDFLGKGIGTEATRLFVEKLFNEHEAKRIIVDPNPKNTRAIRVYEKAGFKKVGEIDTPDGRALLMENKAPK